MNEDELVGPGFFIYWVRGSFEETFEKVCLKCNGLKFNVIYLFV
jgi:hypothetical protein